MPKSVDTRVVQMQFDNRQFEKNINQTIASLEQLDESLQLKDASKSFDKISQSAREVSLAPLGNAVETVKVKFSALEVMAITALTNITNKAVNAGERLVKSLSVDNIASGWQKFEDTTTSVGTLISQGFSMDEVTEQLDKLNWFTDETSYNFTDMVSNIGKFTATGASLDESVQAMMGIANWAALSGQNAQKASMAMYQLSQAMSKGVLKYDDWKSISNASMDTKEFRMQAAEAAVAVGTLKKTSDGLYKTLKGHTVSLNELFSSDYMSRDAWFTKNVMMQTFTKYSSAVNKLYEEVSAGNFSTASEAIAALGDDVDAFGLKAFKAAQEARTWTDVVSSVKDAVSSKWKDTFELIIGDYKEAKRLFTGLANMLYGIFAEGGNKRNTILALWKGLGGREKLLDGLAAGFWAIKDAIDAVKQAFAEIFVYTDETWENLSEDEIEAKKAAQKADQLVEATEKFRKTMYSISAFVRANAGNIVAFFKGVFSVVKTVSDGVVNLLHAILPITKPIKSLPQLILSILGAVGRLLSSFAEWIREGNLLTIVLNAIKTALGYVGKAILFVAGIIITIGSSIRTIISNIVKSKFVQNIVNGIATGFAVLGGAIYTAYIAIKNFLITITDPALAAESNSPVVKTISSIIQFFKNLGLTVYNAVIKIREFIGSLSGLSVGEKVKTIFNSLKGVKDKAVEKIFGKPEEGANSLLSVIDKLKESFSSFFKNIDTGTMIAFAFTASIIGVSGALAGLLKNASLLAGNASGLLVTIKKVVTKAYAKSVGILNIAEAFAIIAASLFLLSKAEPAALYTAAAVMGQILLVLTAMVGVVMFLSTIFKKKKLFENFSDFINNFGKTIIMMGASVLAIAGALLILQNVRFSWEMVANLGIAVAAVGLLGLIAVIVSRFSKKGFTGMAGIATMLVLALSLNRIVKAIKDLSELNPQDVLDTTLAISPLLLSFGALAAGIGQIKLGTVIGFLVVMKLFNKIIPEIEQLLVNLDSPVLLNKAAGLQSLFGNLAFLGTLATVIIALAIRGKEIGAATKGIAMLVLSIAGLLAFMVYLTKENFSISYNVMNAFVLISAFISMFIGLSQFTAQSKMIAFSISMILLTGVMFLMVGLFDVIKSLEITFADTIPFIVLGAIIGLLEGLSALTAKSKVLSLMVIISGILAVCTMMLLLSRQPMEGLIGAGAALLFAFTGLALAISAMSKLMDSMSKSSITKNKGFGKRFGELILDLVKVLVPMAALAGMMIVISKVLSQLSSITDMAQLAITAGIIVAMLGAITALTKWMTTFKMTKTNSRSVGIVLLGFIGLISVIGLTLAALNKEVSWEQLLASAGAMVLVIAAVTGAALIMGKFKGTSAIGLAILAGGLLLIGGVLAVYNLVFDHFVKTLLKLKSAVANNPVGTLIDQVISSVNLLKTNKDDIKKEFETLGEYMVDGLYNGISNNLGRLEELGAKLFIKVDTGLKNEADIGSPSREMYQRGVWMVEGFNNGMSGSLRILDKTGSEMASKVLTPFEELPKNIRSAGSEAAKAASESGVDVAKSALKPVAVAAEGIEKVSKYSNQSVQNEAIDAVTTVQAIAEAGGMALLQSTSYYGAGVVAAAEITAGGLDVSSEAEQSLEKVDQVIETHYEWWQYLLNVFATPIRAFIDFDPNKSFGDWWKDAWNDQLKGTASLIPSAGQKLGKGVNDVISYVEGKASTVFDGLKKAIGWEDGDDPLSFITSKTGELKKEFAELFGLGNDTEGADGLNDYLNNLNESLNNTASSAGKAKSRLESLKDTIKSQIDIFSKFNEQVEMIEEEVYDPETNTTSLVQREKTGADMAEEMLANMESQIFGVTEWSNNMAKLAMMGLDQGLLQELGALGPQGASKVKAFVSMTDEQLQRANYLYATSTKLPDYAANEVEASYRYAGEMAVKGFSKALDPYIGIVEYTGEETIRVIDEYAPQFYTHSKKAGGNIPAGLEAGIKEKLQNVSTAVALVAHNSIKTFQKETDQHSPSKVFKRLGSFLDEGLAIGITDGESGVLDSISSLASSVIDSTTKFFESDNSLTLTPILDLSEIQNGAGELKSTFGNAQVGIASAAFNAKIAADHEIVNAQIQSTRVLAAAMQSNTDRVVEAIVNSDTPVNVNLTLQGDSAQLFKLVRQENAKFTKINGYNAFAY